MILYGLKDDPNFSNISGQILVSCPSEGESVGGLFLLDFQHNLLTKVLAADCRGIERYQNNVVIATNSNGILILNEDLTLKMSIDVPKLDLHGIAIFQDVLIVVETALNKVGFYDLLSMKRTGELLFHESSEDQLHLNDIFIDEDGRLLISMFSPEGNWKSQADEQIGAVAAINISLICFTENQQVNINDYIIKSNLFMPHSIQVYNRGLYYCNSMLFEVVLPNNRMIKYQGFTRGLFLTEEFIMTGQSRMRHLNRITDKYDNCSVECGVHLFRKNRKVSRFIPIPAFQIYQIMGFKDRDDLEKNSYIIEFGDARSDAYLVNRNAWHDSEYFRWTADICSEIRFSIPNRSINLRLLIGSSYPGVYTCNILLNYFKVKEVCFEEPGEKMVLLSVDSNNARSILLGLEVPFLWSPKKTLGTEDGRQLGIRIKFIEVLVTDS